MWGQVSAEKFRTGEVQTRIYASLNQGKIRENSNPWSFGPSFDVINSSDLGIPESSIARPMYSSLRYTVAVSKQLKLTFGVINYRCADIQQQEQPSWLGKRPHPSAERSQLTACHDGTQTPKKPTSKNRDRNSIIQRYPSRNIHQKRWLREKENKKRLRNLLSLYCSVP